MRLGPSIALVFSAFLLASAEPSSEARRTTTAAARKLPAAQLAAQAATRFPRTAQFLGKAKNLKALGNSAGEAMRAAGLSAKEVAVVNASVVDVFNLVGEELQNPKGALNKSLVPLLQGVRELVTITGIEQALKAAQKASKEFKRLPALERKLKEKMKTLEGQGGFQRFVQAQIGLRLMREPLVWTIGFSYKMGLLRGPEQIATRLSQPDVRETIMRVQRGFYLDLGFTPAEADQLLANAGTMIKPWLPVLQALGDPRVQAKVRKLVAANAEELDAILETVKLQGMALAVGHPEALATLHKLKAELKKAKPGVAAPFLRSAAMKGLGTAVVADLKANGFTLKQAKAK